MIATSNGGRTASVPSHRAPSSWQRDSMTMTAQYAYVKLGILKLNIIQCYLVEVCTNQLTIIIIINLKKKTIIKLKINSEQKFSKNF